MSDPASLVHAVYAAFGRGDLPALLACLHDDVQWTFEGSTGEAYMRTARGHDDVMRWFQQVLAVDGVQVFEPRETLAAAGHVTVLGWERTQALPDGGVFETPWIHVWWIRGDRVSRFVGMFDTAAAARARPAP